MPRHAEKLPKLAHAASHRSQPARHSRRARAHDLRRRLLTALLGVVLFCGSSVAFGYMNLQSNVSTHDLDSILGANRGTREGQEDEEEPPGDPAEGEPINVLVLGNDAREEDEGGTRADTTMLVHISAERDRVEVVSIPRDTLVDIPSCPLPDGGQTPPAYQAMFNSAFARGGQTGDTGYAAACTLLTVQDMTGLYIDDFVVVDFAGFEAVVDSLDGVPMYIPEDIDDWRANDLVLEQGCQLLGGRDALGYARVRYSVGDGSDIQRIGRQQQLVAAIAREALSARLLTDLPALYQFLDASTATLDTGEWVGQLTTMAGIANALRGIDVEEIRFATMPHLPAGARVVPAPEAEEMWAALREDRPIDADIDGTGEEPTAPDPGTGGQADPDAEQPTTPDTGAGGPDETAPATTEEDELPSCTRADVK